MEFLSYDGRDIILDSVADGVFTVDQNWCVTSFNHAAERITGIPRQQALGQCCKNVLKADLCETGCALRQTMETGQPVINKPVHIVDSQGRRKSITISSALLKNREGQIIGGVETFRDMTLVEELRKQLEKQYGCEDIISRSHKVQQLFDVLPRVAESDCTVLIEGETGTGKELFAHALRSLSPRSKKPFVTVNCSALPDTLLESELFGYKAGAFTDAKKDKPGRFALAQGGTLFLDEIGDISPAVQVRLLRVLQDKTYEPLGGVSTIEADVRVVTATNKNLAELVDKGVFRKDLFYRINVVRFELPPLRERKEDIPLLAHHFIRKFAGKVANRVMDISPEAIDLLMSYNWRGNVRELENAIERAMVLTEGNIILPEHLPLPAGMGMTQNEMQSRPMTGSLTEQIDAFERRLVLEALGRAKWVRSKAAAALGIPRPTLNYKMIKHNIEPPKDDES